jgi:hypothetical protein
MSAMSAEPPSSIDQSPKSRPKTRPSVSKLQIGPSSSLRNLPCCPLSPVGAKKGCGGGNDEAPQHAHDQEIVPPVLDVDDRAVRVRAVRSRQRSGAIQFHSYVTGAF